MKIQLEVDVPDDVLEDLAAMSNKSKEEIVEYLEDYVEKHFATYLKACLEVFLQLPENPTPGDFMRIFERTLQKYFKDSNGPES